MSLYSYKAMDPDGRLIRGQIDAANTADLELRLKRLDLDFVNGRVSDGRRHFFSRSVSRRELVDFCFQMEMLIQAGVPILESLTELRDQAGNGRYREIMAGLVESIQGGQALSASIERHPDVFSGVFVAVVRTGETAGRLPEVLKHLLEALKWEDELAAYTRRILIYPGILFSLILAAVVLSMIFVVPQLSHLFDSAGLPLPLHTRALIALSRFFVDWWFLILGGVLGLGALAWAALRWLPGARLRFDGWKLRMPFFGSMLEKLILCRFASFFALLYNSGISILEAVRMGEEIVGNRTLGAGLKRAHGLISEGRGVAEAFEATRIFPVLVLRMLRVGEQAGRLDKALGNVAYFYSRDVKESAERAQAMLEPLLSVFLGGIMLWVMLSVMGPIYDIMTRMRL